MFDLILIFFILPSLFIKNLLAIYMQDEYMNHRARFLVAITLTLLLLFFGCVSSSEEKKNETSSEPTTAEGITKSGCEKAGGHWNECGSACRGAPEGTMCIDVCVAYCECGGIAGFKCPEGYVCTDYLPKGATDAIGVCKKK
jgi:hypothetical protein